MNWEYILTIVLLFICCICCLLSRICLPILTSRVTSTWEENCVESGLIKVNTSTAICEVKQCDLESSHEIKYEYTKFKPLSMYEYKIENTRFPIVIENIIKEYIGFRLLLAYNGMSYFTTNYPNKFINVYVPSNYNIPTNNVLYYKSNVITSYTIEPEGGFEIIKSKNSLDIKIE